LAALQLSLTGDFLSEGTTSTPCSPLSGKVVEAADFYASTCVGLDREGELMIYVAKHFNVAKYNRIENPLKILGVGLMIGVIGIGGILVWMA
jgi:hypothetical protein